MISMIWYLIKNIICKLKKHNKTSESCPYTMKTYTYCFKCGTRKAQKTK